MTIIEAAQRLGKSESALRRAIKAKKLSATMVNGKYDISNRALDAYAPDRREVGAPTRGTEEMERLRVENETLRRELEDTGKSLEEKDSQIAELMEKLHDAEKKAILADELLADKKRLQQQLEAKDGQIGELQKALQQAQVNLDHNQQLLAYAQLPWWRKLGRKALPQGDVVDMEPDIEEKTAPEEN